MFCRAIRSLMFSFMARAEHELKFCSEDLHLPQPAVKTSNKTELEDIKQKL